MSKKSAVLIFFLTVLASIPACGGGVPPAQESRPLPIPSQDWVLVGENTEVPALHSQGLAAVPALGPTDFVFTSQFTIDRTEGGEIAALSFAFSKDLLDLGFDHLGDPDARGTRVYGGIEDNSNPVHPYHRGFVVYDAETLSMEGWSNDPGSPDDRGDGDAPWVAVSPDGNWVVTGEYRPMRNVIVFRADTLVAEHTVQEEARIPLDSPFNDVQGCDFDGPRVLVCSSNDGDTGRLLYALILSGPLQGETVPQITAHVESLFPIPIPPPQCDNAPEVEGLDVDGETLRVLVIGSCRVDSHLYRFERCTEGCP